MTDPVDSLKRIAAMKPEPCRPGTASHPGFGGRPRICSRGGIGCPIHHGDYNRARDMVAEAERALQEVG